MIRAIFLCFTLVFLSFISCDVQINLQMFFSVFNVTPESADPGETVKINVQIESTNPVAHIQLDLTEVGGGDSVSMISLTPTNWQYTYKIPSGNEFGLPSGIYEITANAQDTSYPPRKGESKTEFQINNVAPDFERVSPIPDRISINTTDNVLLITAKVMDPNSQQDISAVVADLTELNGGSNLILNDDGINGDLTASDGVYSLEFSGFDAPSAMQTLTCSLTVSDVHNLISNKQFTIEIIDPPVINSFTDNSPINPGETLTFSANVSPGVNPIGVVEIDLTNLGGNAKNNMVTSNGVDFEFQFTLPADNETGILKGTYQVECTASDDGSSGDVMSSSEMIDVVVNNAAPQFLDLSGNQTNPVILSTASLPTNVKLTATVNDPNGHRNEQDDLESPGFVEVEIPAELNNGSPITITLFDDGTNGTDEQPFDGVFTCEHLIPAGTAQDDHDIVFTIEDSSGASDSMILKIIIGDVQITNFPTSPTEVFVEQEISDFEFTVHNDLHQQISITDVTFYFSSDGGNRGDRNSEFTVVADPANPTTVVASGDVNLKYSIGIKKTVTKASSTAPLSVEVSLSYNPGAKIVNSGVLEWAVRTWEAGANIPDNRIFGGAAILNNHIYYLGGHNGAPSNIILDYDIARDQWSTHVATLPNAMYHNTAITVGNKIYIVGGYDGTDYLDTVYVFDGNAVTLDGNVLNTRIACALATDGTYIYVVGGGAASGYSLYDTIERYTPGVGTSVKMNSKLPTGKYKLGAGYKNEHCYLVCGNDGSAGWWQGTTNAQDFNVNSDTISNTTSLIYPVSCFAYSQLGDYIYLVAGYNTAETKVVQRFNMANQTVQSIGKLPIATYGNTGTASSNAIFSLGGNGSQTATWKMLLD